MLLALLLVLPLAACAGGSSDVAGGGGGESTAEPGDGGSLSLVAFAVPKVAFDRLIPAFNDTEEGRGVSFSQSYGASGDQSRKVESGLPTDIALFSLEPDMKRLVDAGMVEESWKDGEHGGVPAGSVVTMVVREGNPKGVEDWEDLVRDDVEIVSPNPLSSGSAKWNLLAPYLHASDGGQDQAAGLDVVESIIGNLNGQPKSGREATELFLSGVGDVLLSYENEALLIEEDGEDVEHVTPPSTLRIENPFAVLKDSSNREAAEAFRDFLYSEDGQRLWAEAGFRPVDEAVAEEYADKYPAPETLYTVEEIGGWDKVNAELFDPEDGAITRLYQDANA